jgi:hypothetical protein
MKGTLPILISFCLIWPENKKWENGPNIYAHHAVEFIKNYKGRYGKRVRFVVYMDHRLFKHTFLVGELKRVAKNDIRFHTIEVRSDRGKDMTGSIAKTQRISPIFDCTEECIVILLDIHDCFRVQTHQLNQLEKLMHKNKSTIGFTVWPASEDAPRHFCPSMNMDGPRLQNNRENMHYHMDCGMLISLQREKYKMSFERFFEKLVHLSRFPESDEMLLMKYFVMNRRTIEGTVSYMLHRSVLLPDPIKCSIPALPTTKDYKSHVPDEHTILTLSERDLLQELYVCREMKQKSRRKPNFRTLFCYCRKVAKNELFLQCASELCPFVWVHAQCEKQFTGNHLKVLPDHWECSQCSKKALTTRQKAIQLKKERQLLE